MNFQKKWRSIAFMAVFSSCGLTQGQQQSNLKDSNTNTNTNATTTTVAVSSRADNMRAFSELIKAQAIYVTSMADARLKDAERQRTLALAAQEWIRVRALNLEVDRLELEYRRARQKEYELLRQQEIIEGKAETANRMLVGRVDARSLGALTYLQIKVISPETTFNVMGKAIESFPASDFVGNSSASTPASFPGGNVGQLFEFLKTRNLGVDPYSPAHMVIISAIKDFAAGANQEIARLEEQMTRIQVPRPGHP
jgi:multidrug efflux pump subunit AcrA (membrane-fusion protein)